MSDSQGFVVWFTGLSGAGKSTLAERLAPILRERGRRVEVLDGDVVRTNLSKGLGFSKEDAARTTAPVGVVPKPPAGRGGAVLPAAISPDREVRDEVRRLVEGDGSVFVEVYAAATLEECEARDVKGLYAEARAGKRPGFTGIDDPYEPPLSPEVVCHTGKESVDESLARILRYLESRSLIPAAAEVRA